MTKTKQWKKWMAVGCSHGDNIDPEARKAVLEFKKSFKPDVTLHLGDFTDLAALRSGAVANPNCPDRAKNIAEDVAEGVDFLYELQPQHILFGNHEHRIMSYLNSPNAMAAHAANTILESIKDCAKKLKAKTYDYNIRAYAQIGDTKFVHGTAYGISAVRDHAEMYGNVVLAHLHRTGIEQARTMTGATGYCIGMLARFDMEYAQMRRQTFAWKQGFGYGWFCDNQCITNVVSRGYGQPWMLP